MSIAKSYPLPTSISEAGRAALSEPAFPVPVYPAIDDHAGWRALIKSTNEQFKVSLLPMMAPMAESLKIVPDRLAEVPVYRVTPAEAAANDRRICLDFHGGALIYLGGEMVGQMAGRIALHTSMPVLSVDYRMPPDHPFPAGLDDAVNVYRALLATCPPEQIVVSGASAGGNFAAAMVLRARDEGLPLPAALVLLTPEIDLTESGDTFETIMGIDSRLTHRFTDINALYAAGESLAHPYVSPLFGDFTKGYPPTFLQSGTRDLFLSNTVRMHRALRGAGIPSDLHVFEAMPHGGFWQGPEEDDLTREVRLFIARYCPQKT